MERERHHQTGSRGVIGVDGERATVSLDDLACDGQAQPGAPGGTLAGVVEAREALERPGRAGEAGCPVRRR